MHRRAALLFALVACARTVPVSEPAVAKAPPPPPPLPAGTCGFEAYLGSACEAGAPRFAVVALHTNDPHAAERALRAAPHADGYPFAVSFDDLPAKDPAVQGIAVVAGLYANREDADAAARGRATVIELATKDEYDRRRYSNVGAYQKNEEQIERVVEIAAETPAYRAEDLEQVEKALDEELATHWVPLPAQQMRRADALAASTPACNVAAGRVFVTHENELYEFRRKYAPVRCDDGREAWVPWRATRLESTVDSGKVSQVILVECDVPTVETRPFGPRPPKELGALTDESCGDDEP